MENHMGVIYKLKENVIDYIVQTKKENSQISCRQLAKAASDKFQVDISKSSVNSVIKVARLSSPIGRRAARNVQSSKKFEIPSERKKQLFDSSPTNFYDKSKEKEKTIDV